MAVRRPVVRGQFYPYAERECIQEMEKYLSLKLPEGIPDKIVAGIVPHAGWVFSGRTAACVFKAIEERANPQTFILFGAVHTWGVSKPAIMAEGSWESPLGEVEVDQELGKLILKGREKEYQVGAKFHQGEHSLEVQIPFIRYLFPGAKIVPIMIPPNERAFQMGLEIGEVLPGYGNEVVAVGTSDLTHYGANYHFAPRGEGEEALRWVKEVNDRRIIDLVLQLKEREIVREANAHHNACGAGAIAATVAWARSMGAKRGTLLHYTTSFDVMPQGYPTMFVGYAGIVF